MKTGMEIESYSPTKAALADLTSRFKGLVFDVTTPKGMADAKGAKKELAAHRITLEKARVAEKAEALAYGKHVDAEAKKIADQLAALEDPITEQIETETKREQREREAAARRAAQIEREAPWRARVLASIPDPRHITAAELRARVVLPTLRERLGLVTP